MTKPAIKRVRNYILSAPGIASHMAVGRAHNPLKRGQWVIWNSKTISRLHCSNHIFKISYFPTLLPSQILKHNTLGFCFEISVDSTFLPFPSAWLCLKPDVHTNNNSVPVDVCRCSWQGTSLHRRQDPGEKISISLVSALIQLPIQNSDSLLAQEESLESHGSWIIPAEWTLCQSFLLQANIE